MPTASNQNSNLRNRIKLRHLETKKNFRKKHPHAQLYFENLGVDPGKIREHSAKILTAGAIGSALLLSSGSPYDIPGKSNPVVQKLEQLSISPTGSKPLPLSLPLPAPAAQVLADSGKVFLEDLQQWSVNQLAKILPHANQRYGLPLLHPEEERIIGRIIERSTGIKTRESLEGERLNTVYGHIGAEQHLARFPGDSIKLHEFQDEGMAPGLGAWGYFAQSGKLTQDAIMREKYYVAVQTLYLPGWNTRFRYLRDWYKWRKVIVINPENGQAVVAVVGDAGPANWTGKQFGGSPETMHTLGGQKYKKGRVLLYLVDDPENKVPLGPVDYSKLNVPVVQPI